MEHPCCCFPVSAPISILFPSLTAFVMCLFAHYSHCFSSISFILHALQVALGRNQPLKRERPKWKSDYPMTEGQLRSKRDEFWDTAPAFEGRKEIWDALRAAASAFESNDHLLAQAILDGASITLPHGKNTSVNKYGFLRSFGAAGWIHSVAADDYQLKNFQLLLPQFLERSHSVSRQECLCVSAGLVFKTGS